MSTSDRDTANPARAALEPIAIDDCMELLQQQHVGRVAFMRDGRIEILPLNYVLAEGALVFRTDGGGMLEAFAGQEVVFEIDQVDPRTRGGWSISVTGRVEEIWDPEEIATAQELPLHPWAPGERSRYVWIWPAAITGRRIVRQGGDAP